MGMVLLPFEVVVELSMSMFMFDEDVVVKRAGECGELWDSADDDDDDDDDEAEESVGDGGCEEG